MILIYCFLALLMAIPVLPLLFLKTMVNNLYIIINIRRKLKNNLEYFMVIMWCFIQIFVNIPIIVTSFLVDLILLPGILF